jgi:hypothetical protein
VGINAVPEEDVSYDAFICYYRRTGAALAQLFRAKLESLGLRVFLDVEASYWGPFPRELRERVSGTPHFIVLLTEGCLGSNWMNIEIAEAIRTQRKIVVIREASFQLPDPRELAPPVRDLVVLNHITYVHDFSDEVLRRVVALVKRRDRRQFSRRRVVILAAAALLSCGGYLAYYYRHSEVFGSRSPTSIQHPESLRDPIERTEQVSSGQAQAPEFRTAAVSAPSALNASPPSTHPTSSSSVTASESDGSGPAAPLRIAPEGSGVPSANESLPHERSVDPHRLLKPTPAKPRGVELPVLAAPPLATNKRCSPNYYFDANGEKRFKRECFVDP